MPIEYTGSILLADDFIRERCVHMGFQSPLSYRKVIEFNFQDGHFIWIKRYIRDYCTVARNAGNRKNRLLFLATLIIIPVIHLLKS